MICPACSYELMTESDHCENCGAPSYLATGIQLSEETHCTYCGSRDDKESAVCRSCGLKKDFKTSETAIGTCRNCGLSWRNTWMYCRDCGIARENALIISVNPIPIKTPSFGEYFRAQSGPVRTETIPDTKATLQAETTIDYGAFEFEDLKTEPEFPNKYIPAHLMSEIEVVGRMFGNGSYKNEAEAEVETAFPSGFSGLPQTLSFETEEDFPREAQPAEILPGGPSSSTLTGKNNEPRQTAQTGMPQPIGVTPKSVSAESPVIFPLSAPSEKILSEEKPVVAKPSYPKENRAPHPNLSTVDEAAPAKSTETQTATPPQNAKTIDSVNKAKTTSGPVQAVKVIHKPRSGATPPVDKRLVQIIFVLIVLILLFSALIVTGFRIRDLFSPRKPLPATVETPASVGIDSPPARSGSVPTAPQEMVYIPGGEFRMGSDNGDSYEAPAHEVKVNAFFLDRTEVTNEQYARFLQATSHQPPLDWKDGNFSAETAKFPVVNITWNEASDYAKWAGKRLPTEAEWEFAARSTDGRIYSWGNNWNPNFANTLESNLGHPVETGKYSSGASPFGVLDLTGNVWEWIDGEINSYKDPRITLAPGKVIRGGAYYLPRERATTTYRGFAPPDKISEKIGFRCAKNIN